MTADTRNRYFDVPDEIDVSDELRSLLTKLASAHPTRATVVHSKNHGSVHGEFSDMLSPSTLRAIQDSGARIVYAGVKEIPPQDSPRVAFFHGSAIEGRTVGWCEVKFDE